GAAAGDDGAHRASRALHARRRARLRALARGDGGGQPRPHRHPPRLCRGGQRRTCLLVGAGRGKAVIAKRRWPGGGPQIRGRVSAQSRQMMLADIWGYQTGPDYWWVILVKGVI